MALDTEGSWNWQNIITDAMKTYAQVETAKASRGMAGAYEDRDAALQSVPRMGVEASAASYAAPASPLSNPLLWLAVGGGVLLVLVVVLKK